MGLGIRERYPQPAFPVLENAFRNHVVIVEIGQGDKFIRFKVEQISYRMGAVRLFKMPGKLAENAAVENKKLDKVPDPAPFADRDGHGSRRDAHGDVRRTVLTCCSHLNFGGLKHFNKPGRRGFDAFQWLSSKVF